MSTRPLLAESVDAALTELEEAEKERTRKALAYVNAQRRERQKPSLFVTGWGLVKFMAGVVFFGLLGWLFLIGAFSL